MATKRTPNEILAEGKRRAEAAVLRMHGTETPPDNAHQTDVVREREIQMRLLELQDDDRNLLEELIRCHRVEAGFIRPIDEAEAARIRTKKTELRAEIAQEFANLEALHLKAMYAQFLKTDATDVTEPRKITKASVRKPPKGDEQPDFFVPSLYDVATKDSRDIMDVAVFRLSKKDKRANETIR